MKIQRESFSSVPLQSIEHHAFEPTYFVRTVLILFFTALTALAAHIKIPVPGTVVPMTMQTAIVLLAGLKLKRWDGALSQLLYLLGGSIGLPFFATQVAGGAALSGPTGGYLIGFVFAAAFVGYFKKFATNLISTWFVLFFASLLVFIPGVIQLKLVLQTIAPETVKTWGQVFMLGVIPFIIGDLLKVTLVTTIQRLTSK